MGHRERIFGKTTCPKKKRDSQFGIIETSAVQTGEATGDEPEVLPTHEPIIKQQLDEEEDISPLL